VAFTLGSGNDTTVVLNSSDWDSDNICMSVTSLVGGLVMLLGKQLRYSRFRLPLCDNTLTFICIFQGTVQTITDHRKTYIF
jgi:hypothetical protein